MVLEPRQSRSIPDKDRHRSIVGKGFSLDRFSPKDRRLILGCCLLALVALTVNVIYLVDVTSELGLLRNGGSPNAEGLSEGARGHYESLLVSCRNRILLLLGMMVICVGSVIYLAVKKIMLPLDVVARAADEISRGNLNVTIPSNPGGEIGELAEIINDMAVNFQEVLLLTGTAVGNSCIGLEKLEQLLQRQPCASHEDLSQQIRMVKKDLEMLTSVVKDFEYYQTQFDGRRVVGPGPER